MARKMIGTFVLAAVVAAAGLLRADATAPAAKIGHPAPPFTLNDQNGKPVSLSAYAGKIVVLTWINHECPYVQRHLKAQTFQNLADKYKGKNVVWLAIDSTNWHDQADNLKTVQDNKLPFPVLNDASGTVGHEYDAKTTPEEYIINTDGALAYMGGIDNDQQGDKGAARVNYVDKALTELLSGKSVSVSESKSYGCSVKYK